MIIAFIRIDPIPDKRKAIIEILTSVKTVTSLKVGCINCGIYEEYGNGQKILYIEMWHNSEDMYQHIRSNLYLRILNAVELASKQPEIYFQEYSEKEGIELIEAVRSDNAAKQEV